MPISGNSKHAAGRESEDSGLLQLVRSSTPEISDADDRVLAAWKQRGDGADLAGFLVDSGVISRQNLKTWRLMNTGYLKGLDNRTLVDQEAVRRLAGELREEQQGEPPTVSAPELPPAVSAPELPPATPKKQLIIRPQSHRAPPAVAEPQPAALPGAGSWYQPDPPNAVLALTVAMNTVPVTKCACPSCFGPIRLAPSQRGERTSCPHCATAFSAPAHAFAPGSIIDDYLVDQELGRGASGVVIRCRQMTLDRPIALKILPAGSDVDTEAFIREARIVARLNHPNIVQAFAASRLGGCRMLAMECVDGPSVKDRIARHGALPPDEAIRIVRETALALDCAWTECRLIHRDVKPGNILLDSRQRVKLTDFGLACTSTNGDDDEILGTPMYMPPEVIAGEALDHRADQYSLGAVLYHLITGQPPFMSDNIMTMLNAHAVKEPTPPSARHPQCPKTYDPIILRMLAKKPDDRFPDYASLIAALDQTSDSTKGLRHGLTTVIRRITRRD